MSVIKIIENEDPSLQKLLDKTATDLRRKYTKQRKINEKLLGKKQPAQKVLSIILDIVCAFLFIIGFIICFATINTSINGYVPNFAGYSNLVISTHSMVASGYNRGDVVIVHSVDVKTLNVGDKIAFYLYPPSYQDFDIAQTQDISSTTNKTKYTFTFRQMLGFQTKEVAQAEKSNSDIIFHHIRAIYRDANGEIWLKTYGSSNSNGDDSWWVNEKYVLGVEDDGVLANSVIWLVKFALKPYSFVVLMIPLSILLFSVVLAFLKNVQIAKLEIDCVEEKRKITDNICVKNNVGFQMSEKTKLKILAQATDDNRGEYMNLLWRKPPDSIKKYHLRKKVLLSTNRDLLELNRECEMMFKNGEKPNKIAKYYLSRKQQIEQKGEIIKKRIKSIDKYKNKHNRNGGQDK